MHRTRDAIRGRTLIGSLALAGTLCADNLTTTFLVDGKMPSKDRC
jgi:hypothetical protein